MTKVEFLTDQIIESRNFVKRIISELPEDLWFTIPENTDSNFAWQIGHLMMSQNFHTLTVISGRNSKVYSMMSVADYVKAFNGMGALHRSVEKGFISATKLINEFNAVHEICLENLHSLNDDILIEKLEPIPFKHPVADIKYDALSWSFKHEMWHSAEMESIKRALGYPIKWLRD